MFSAAHCESSSSCVLSFISPQLQLLHSQKRSWNKVSDFRVFLDLCSCRGSAALKAFEFNTETGREMSSSLSLSDPLLRFHHSVYVFITPCSHPSFSFSVKSHRSFLILNLFIFTKPRFLSYTFCFLSLLSEFKPILKNWNRDMFSTGGQCRWDFLVLNHNGQWK